MSPTFEATFWEFVSGGALVIGATVGYVDSFHANGIEVAFPQRDLHIKKCCAVAVFERQPPIWLI